MKLKGEVEVFKIMKDGGSTSVLKESNMVVDGASEVIVDMLTTPYSLKNLAGSETLNPSNFTVQAVTLGKASELYGGQPETSAADTDVIGMHCVYNTQELSSLYFNIGTSPEIGGDDWVGARNLTGASSFTPSTKLPKTPFPGDVGLEDSSRTQIELYYELSDAAVSGGLPETSGFALPFGVSDGWDNASALVSSKGHNLNSFYSSSVKSMETLFQGCYAPSNGIDVFIWDASVTRSVVINSTNPAALLLSSVNASAGPVLTPVDPGYGEGYSVSGRYNTVGSMDKHGYLVAYPIQHHPASGDPTQGVIVSAGTTNSLVGLGYDANGLLAGSEAFLASPAVCYNFSISSSDLLALAAYKGVTNIGLWALDLEETLKLESPPLAWGAPTNNRRYKLFSKKVFSEDLTTIQDNPGADVPYAAGMVNYTDLNIEWRLNFDFGETF
jgi:hypothetical protein